MYDQSGNRVTPRWQSPEELAPLIADARAGVADAQARCDFVGPILERVKKRYEEHRDRHSRGFSRSASADYDPQHYRDFQEVEHALAVCANLLEQRAKYLQSLEEEARQPPPPIVAQVLKYLKLKGVA